MIFGNKEQILYRNRFNGTKGNGYQPIKKEQTNEEWFDGLSTEEKAEALTKVVLNIVSWNNDPRPSEVRNIFKTWLKQPRLTSK